MRQQSLRNRAALGVGLCLAFGALAAHASTADGVKLGVLAYVPAGARGVSRRSSIHTLPRPPLPAWSRPAKARS